MVYRIGIRLVQCRSFCGRSRKAFTRTGTSDTVRTSGAALRTGELHAQPSQLSHLVSSFYTVQAATLITVQLVLQSTEYSYHFIFDPKHRGDHAFHATMQTALMPHHRSTVPLPACAVACARVRAPRGTRAAPSVASLVASPARHACLRCTRLFSPPSDADGAGSAGGVEPARVGCAQWAVASSICTILEPRCVPYTWYRWTVATVAMSKGGLRMSSGRNQWELAAEESTSPLTAPSSGSCTNSTHLWWEWVRMSAT